MAKSALVQAMRSFRFENIDLAITYGDSDATDPDSKKQRKQNVLARTFAYSGVAGTLVCLVLMVNAPGVLLEKVFFGHGIILAFLILSLGAMVFGAKAWEIEETRRWNRFAEANKLEVIGYGTPIPGDLRSGRLVTQGFRPLDPVTKPISFGVCHAWFDFDSKWPVGAPNAADSFEEIMFIQISLPELESYDVYMNPKRNPDFMNLPTLSETGKVALMSLSAKYAVYIGKGSIVLSHSPSRAVPVTASMEYTDLSLPSRWSIINQLIRGDLANLVEGIRS